MGGKPRTNPIEIEDEHDADGLCLVPEMEVADNGKSKKAGIIIPHIGGEAISIFIHRKIDGPDITAMNITHVEFKRLGRGMAAMDPSATKQLRITVKYKDNT